jgi:D-glycero-D-manno-heptose 1,7-bisphosphate phosphatase
MAELAVGRRAVFLDRDGVVNRAVVRAGKPYPPASSAELEILPGIEVGLSQLKAAGFDLIVVTNQPDVARGTQSRAQVEDLHAVLQAWLPIDEFQICYHDDADDCACRKPKPGLLLNAARTRGIDLAKSYLIGDRWRDVAAGQQAGCTCLFIDYGYAEAQPTAPYIRCTSAAEAIQWILTRR